MVQSCAVQLPTHAGTAGTAAGVVLPIVDAKPLPLAVEFVTVPVGKLELGIIEVKLVYVPLTPAIPPTMSPAPLVRTTWTPAWSTVPTLRPASPPTKLLLPVAVTAESTVDWVTV